MTARGEDSAGAGEIHLSDPSPKFPPGATLTPITTLSSPWKMGMNLSPRRISAWFRGRNRQSTLMLHSLLVSAMVVAGDGLGALLVLQGRVCAPEEGCSAGAETEDRCSVSGAEKAGGAPGRGLESGAGMRLLALAARGCGRPGRLVLSRRSASPPLALQRRAAGLGGAAAAGRAGLPSRGASRSPSTRWGTFPFLSPPPPPLTLPANLALTPSLPKSLFAAHLPPPRPAPPSDSTPLEGVSGLRWASRFHPFYSGTPSSPIPAPPLSPSSPN